MNEPPVPSMADPDPAETLKITGDQSMTDLRWTMLTLVSRKVSALTGADAKARQVVAANNLHNNLQEDGAGCTTHSVA